LGRGVLPFLVLHIAQKTQHVDGSTAPTRGSETAQRKLRRLMRIGKGTLMGLDLRNPPQVQALCNLMSNCARSIEALLEVCSCGIRFSTDKLQNPKLPQRQCCL